MAGGVCWINELADGSWTITDSGEAYNSSDPENVADPHPSKNYKIDTSTIASDTDSVLDCVAAASLSINMVAVCGITADSADDLSVLQFNVRGTLSAVQVFTTAAHADNAGWAGPDMSGGSIMWTFSSAQTIDTFTLRARRSSGAWDGDWIGVGVVYIGTGIRFGSSAPKLRSGRPWTPVNRDVTHPTPGGGRFSRKRASLKRQGFTVGSMGSDFTEMARSGSTLAAAHAYAGYARPVIATHQSGISAASIYGHFVDNAPMVEEIDDASWRGSFVVEERK